MFVGCCLLMCADVVLCGFVCCRLLVAGLFCVFWCGGVVLLCVGIVVCVCGGGVVWVYLCLVLWGGLCCCC